MRRFEPVRITLLSSSLSLMSLVLQWLLFPLLEKKSHYSDWSNGQFKNMNLKS